MNRESIVLIGMAGVGKSTIGRSLAEALGYEFIDLDEYIMAKDGKSVQKIIDEEDESAFLQLEKQRMYEIDLTRRVVAPGGSIIYHPDLMQYLKQHSTLVYLDDSFENIERRLSDAPIRGIVGLKNKSLREIYEERCPLYSQYADITVNCRDKSTGEIVAEILHFYQKGGSR
jgi:shikimate kinase